MAEWYYVHNEEQLGPVSGTQLKALAASGSLGRDDLVWNQSLPEWTPAGRIRGLNFGGAAAIATPAPAARSAPAPAPAPAEEAPPFENPAELPVPIEEYAEAHAAPAETETHAAAAPINYQTPGGETLPVTSLTIDYLKQTKPWVRFISILIFIGAGFILLDVVVVMASGARALLANSRLGVFIIIAALLYAGLACLYIFPAIYLGRYATRIGKLISSERSNDLELALEAQKSFWKFLGIVTAVFLIIMILLVVVGAIVAASLASSGGH